MVAHFSTADILLAGAVSPFMFSIAMVIFALMFFLLGGKVVVLATCAREGGSPCGALLVFQCWFAPIASPRVLGRVTFVKTPVGLFRFTEGGFCARGIVGFILRFALLLSVHVRFSLKVHSYSHSSCIS